jgi:hypothetical protein
MGKEDDRLTINLKGLRSLIVGYRNDSAWGQLGIAAQIRAMVIDAYAYRHGEDRLEDGEPPPITQLVEAHWQAIVDAGLDITGKRLQEIKAGARPCEKDLMVLARVLPYDADKLTEIRDRDFKEGKEQANGQPSTARL